MQRNYKFTCNQKMSAQTTTITTNNSKLNNLRQNKTKSIKLEHSWAENGLNIQIWRLTQPTLDLFYTKYKNRIDRHFQRKLTPSRIVDRKIVRVGTVLMYQWTAHFVVNENMYCWNRCSIFGIVNNRFLRRYSSYVFVFLYHHIFGHESISIHWCVGFWFGIWKQITWDVAISVCASFSPLSTISHFEMYTEHLLRRSTYRKKKL